jgi:SAM-dependent methyltransferase
LFEIGGGELIRTHAILDSYSREKKARKIERLTSKFSDLRLNKMLEVGCGSGYISSFFSALGYGQQGTYAIDVVDQRQITEGYQFQRVQGTRLPFADETFDFVISNHVVEHVGTADDQRHHLDEIFRSLEPGGTLYFAVPNRWRLIEPHYKLPFLSWLPVSLASAYIRLFKLGSHYDCKPLSRREALNLLCITGFECVEATLDAIPLVGEIEGGWPIRHIAGLPRSFWRLFNPIIPTLIFVCRKL